VKYFVIVYNRPRGQLVRPLEYFGEDEGDEALDRRFELEREFKDHPEYEIVVLGSDSEETIRMTHGRYFKTWAELLTLPESMQGALSREGAPPGADGAARLPGRR
jgi:hypothetical protein